jgi:hypothetical protein
MVIKNPFTGASGDYTTDGWMGCFDDLIESIANLTCPYGSISPIK